ncbi:MFS transporter [Pyrococcus abyssi]|uniref:Glucose-dependent multidrug resistance protein (Multidrug-efflux transporter) n=1 Tax=Pyrococcus abyssi (strain GE5 / Orsay) TaxID=272844 RepID=Q9UZQ7_PYRAB|nr:MFS transporter [Pyrococcus abyssi]CAB49999.1 Glucose-dependent multidrug resistance protein (multidrug-efflux transporter) [Pyrococcus abyssi GE5]CCE70501.1 TPA: multidrug ABC transporter [Pyrococcus abyssi GE5]
MNRNFWLFVAGRFISQLGWAIQEVALPLYVLDVTHSAKIMTLFVLADLIPSIITTPIAGVFGDRYDRKKIMVGFDLIRGVLLFLVIAFNFLTIRCLLVVQVIMAIMNAFFSAGTGAMYPDLVKPEELERANSIVMSASIISRLVGPAIGGFVYGFGGIKLAILMNAISFFGSGLFEIFIKYEWKTRNIEGFSDFVRDIKEGLKFIMSNSFISTLIGLVILLNALGAPFASIIYPYAMREILKFSSQQFGLVESAFMLGALIGNLIVGAFLGAKAGRYIFRLFLVNGAVELIFILIISPFLALPRNSAFMLLLVLGATMGMAGAMINVPLASKLQRAVPSEIRGRVFSTMEMLARIANPLSLVVVGPLVDTIGAWKTASFLWLGSGVVILYYWIFKGKELTSEEESKLVENFPGVPPED